MKKKLQKLLSAKIREKYLALLAVLALAVSLLPLLRLACYAVPWYDDYNFMRSARAFSIQFDKSFLYGAYRTTKQEWYAWQGTYSTTFLTSLNPFIYGEQYQKYSVMGVIIGFALSIIIFCMVLFRNIFHAKKSATLLISAVITETLIGFIYTAQAGLYWYNAAVHYTLMAGIMFLMLAMAIKIFYTKTAYGAALSAFIASLLGIICAGSNYVTILQGLLLLLTIVTLGVLFHKKRTLFMIPPTVIYTFCFYMNVSAPGNKVRGSNFEGDGIVEAVVNSFLAAINHFWEFTGPLMFLSMLLLVPVFWSVINKTDFAFRLPGLVTIYSVCLYATGFVSSRYAMGSDGIDRTWVTVKFTLQLLLFFNEIYWMGWAVKKKKPQTDERSLHYISYYLVVACLMLFFFAISENKIGIYSPYGAYYFIHSGEAYNFYQEYLDRIDIIRSSGPDVVVKPYAYRPWFLMPSDLSESPNGAPNRAMAEWYYKDSIRLQSNHNP